MTHGGAVGTRLQELRQGLERHGVKSPWGKLRVTGLDEKAFSVTLETSNYMFYQQFKTSKLVVPIGELLGREDLTLAPEDRTAILDLHRSIEREAQREEEERQTREEAQRVEEERKRRREEADRRSRAASQQRQEERRLRRERETHVANLVTSVGFPDTEKRKEILDLSREIDDKPGLATAFRLGAQHVLAGSPQLGTHILKRAAELHHRGQLTAESLKAASREAVSVPPPEELEADADAGLTLASWLYAVERGDIGRATLKVSSSLRRLYLELHRQLHSPLKHPERAAANSAAASLFSLRLKPQLLKQSSARAESYVEEARARSDSQMEALAHNNLALTLLCRGLHDEVGDAVRAAGALLATLGADSNTPATRRTRATTLLIQAWAALIVDENQASALGLAVESLKLWPAADDAWDVFVYGTDQHVRTRLLVPFVTALSERLRSELPEVAARFASYEEALGSGSVAGELG